MQSNSVQHKEVGKSPLVSGKTVMVRLNSGSHVCRAVRFNDDIDSVFVSVEPVVNSIGNLILEKGGCFSGINK
jgi:hypothetical protein